MPSLGKKYTCYSCHTKFYDLGKPLPTCPKCGADQRDAEDAPPVTSSRGRRVVEAPIEEEFEAEDDEITPARSDVAEDSEDFVPVAEAEEEDEEEEDY